MLNKIKIGPKLIGGFLFVAVIAIIIGVFGINKMKAIDKADTFLYEKATLPLADLVTISMNFELCMRDLRDLARVKDPQRKEDIIKNIEKYRERMSSASDRYGNANVTEAGKKIFDEFLEARKTIAGDMNLLYTLTRANKDAEVYALIDNQLAKHSEEEENIIEQMITRKVETAKEIAESNTKTANSASALLTAVMAAGVLISILIGLFLTISITRPLNLGVETMEEMAKGNLLVSFDPRLLKVADETGILTRAMKSMTEKLKTTISFALEASENVSSGSIQLSSASQGISQGSSEQAASVEKISASIEEMTASINQNADNANQT